MIVALAPALVLLVAGICLSAFFSGTETGFYRANRLRIQLDALSGDYVSRGLLWLTGHPTILVATVLVGNNLANYLVSLAMVIGARVFHAGEGILPEVLAEVILAPLLFVYGELVPKRAFYMAPNSLLRRCGLPLLVATALLLPITAILWLLSRSIEWFSVESPQRVQLGLARKELQQVFEEGHEAGILHAAQRGLAQGLFASAAQPVTFFATPASRMPRARVGMSKLEMRALARRYRLVEIPVDEDGPRGACIGYVRVMDLCLDAPQRPPHIHPLVDIPATDNYLTALARLEMADEELGRVVDARGVTLGFISVRQLSDPLLRRE